MRYVIRTAGALGAMLPFDQLRRQSVQLMELIDLTAPTFVKERCFFHGLGL